MKELEKLNQKMQTAAGNPYPDRVIVFGEGKAREGIMLVGEAPGGEEEKQKRPFVGSAGKNLNEFLEILKLSREDIYITNVVKIRPFKLSPKTGKPVNRTPDKDEILFFTPFLQEEIKIVKPRYILTLGNVPLHALRDVKDKTPEEARLTIGQLHGQSIRQEGYILYPLYHPASVIYRRELRAVYMEDLRGFAEILRGSEQNPVQ